MFAVESWGDKRLAHKELLALHTKLGHAVCPHLVEQLALTYPDRDASLLPSVARGLVCESCQKRKKAPRCPLVAMPKEPHFNYETGADLWYLRGQPVLHVICLFTRLQHCSVLRDKSATHVCHSLLHLWVKYHGPPVLLYTVLGKEFENELIRMFAERYGITLHCAPGGSHCSLGGVERHHYHLRHTVKLLLEADDTLCLQDACEVACMLLNYHPMPDRGFSPQRLVYRVSSHWPDFVAANLPALAETSVPSDHVGHYMVKFLDAMYRAREKFHAADVRAKVSLAKRSPPSTNHKVELVTGDTVFYFVSLEKAKDSWHGPAVAIGANGDFVVLRHGRSVRRVPLLHCRPASAVLGSPDVDPKVAPVAVPDEAQQGLEDLSVDEAGNELSAEEVAELRRVRDDREPVVTCSRVRAAMSVLTKLGLGLPE